MTLNSWFVLLAAGLGLAFESLVRPGLGLFFFVLLAAVLCRETLRRLERPAGPLFYVAWSVSLVFAGEATLYNSWVVQTYGPLLALWSALCAAALSLNRTPLSELCPTALKASACSPVQWRAGTECLAELKGENLGRVIKGLASGLCLCGLFGLLFMSADQVFEKQVVSGLSWVGADSAWRVARGFIIALFCLGYVRNLTFWPAPAPSCAQRSGDELSSSITLGLVNLLFAAFLAIQLHYLFLHPQELSGLGFSFATYARRGFFELSACTGLVFLLVYAFYSRHREDSWPLGLSAFLCLQTFGVALSALRRMWLYCDEFGLSLLRVYAALGIAAMIVCLSLLLFACWRRPLLCWLRSALVVAGTLTLLITGALDVEDTIARYNLARREPDFAYLSRLSSDALPALAADGRARAAVSAILQRTTVNPDWRNWNRSRDKAVRFAKG